jgi:hypothetical protein
LVDGLVGEPVRFWFVADWDGYPIVRCSPGLVEADIIDYLIKVGMESVFRVV